MIPVVVETIVVDVEAMVETNRDIVTIAIRMVTRLFKAQGALRRKGLLEPRRKARGEARARAKRSATSFFFFLKYN